MNEEVIKFCLSHLHKSKVWVVNDGTYLKPRKKMGRKEKIFDKNEKRKLRRRTDGKIAPSLNSLANEFKVSPTVIKKNLKKMNIQFRKRKSVPKVSLRQKETQRQQLERAMNPLDGQLYPRNNRVIIMDDGSYFGMSRFTASDGYFEGINQVEDLVKYKMKEKFGKKLMVWAALSNRGISDFVVFGRENIHGH